MKTTLTKILCLLLVLVMAFAVVGCKGDEPGKGTTPGNGGNGGSGGGGGGGYDDDDIIEFTLPIQNWNGQRLTVATLDSSPESFFTLLCGEEMLGYDVHDAIFKRDSEMFDTFGIDVFYLPYASGSNGKALLEAVQPNLKGGTYICDMMNAGLKGCMLNLYATNLLYDINSMPLISMDNAWWASYFADGATYNNKLFYTAGMVAGGGYFATPYVMMCNATIQRDVYLEDGTQMDIFALVDEGNWTIATMTDIVTDYSKNLDGIGEFNPEEDLMAFAHVGGGFITGGCHFIGAGGKFCVTTEDGDLDVYNHLTSAETQGLVKDLQNLFSKVSQDNIFGLPDNTQIDAFLSDRALFVGNSMSYVNQVINMGSDYAIIPCPKSNNPAQTEYFSGVNTWTAGFTAYANNLSNPEFVAYASEALGWLSYNKVRPEVYDATLCLRLVRDDERQITIMDEIFANLYIDLNYLNEFGGSPQKLCDSIYKADQNYYTNISKLKNAIGRDIDSFIEDMSENA
jgi:hypothetical protein